MHIPTLILSTTWYVGSCAYEHIIEVYLAGLVLHCAAVVPVRYCAHVFKAGILFNNMYWKYHGLRPTKL